MPWPRFLRFRYSLRALLVLLTLFALWGGYHTNRAMNERRCVVVLLRHGAEVEYSSSMAFSQSFWNERLVSSVHITSNLEEEVIEALATLADPKTISIDSPQLSDPKQHSSFHRVISPNTWAPEGAIERILAKHELTSISLSGFSLTDSAFTAISQHRSLKSLTFWTVNVSEDALARLLVLPCLVKLDLRGCPVEGVNLASVPGSPTLRKVDTTVSPVCPEFAAFLRRCPNLKSLFVSFFHKSSGDDFLAELGPHPSLSQLWIVGPGISDKSVPLLEQLPALRSLTADGLTTEGRLRLTKSRPNLEL